MSQPANAMTAIFEKSPNPKSKKKQRKHSCRWRRSEEVDDEFNRPVYLFIHAEDNTDWDATDGREHKRVKNTLESVPKVFHHVAGNNVGPGIGQRSEGRRKQVRVNELKHKRYPPNRD